MTQALREKILSKLQQTFVLPTAIEVIRKLTDMMRAENTSLGDIAEVVNVDPSMVSRFLKLANSVAFGGATEINSVEDAILRLGTQRAQETIVSIAVMSQMTKCKNVNMELFWTHSLAVAFMSEMIASLSPYSDRSKLFYTAGLLHDIGIIAIDQLEPESYGQVIALKEPNTIIGRERAILDTDHAEVGGKMLRKWGLNECIANAAEYHHFPYISIQNESGIVSKIIHLANFVCNHNGIRTNINYDDNSGFSESSWHDLGLSVDIIPEILAQVHTKLEQVHAMLAIVSTK